MVWYRVLIAMHDGIDLVMVPVKNNRNTGESTVEWEIHQPLSTVEEVR